MNPGQLLCWNFDTKVYYQLNVYKVTNLERGFIAHLIINREQEDILIYLGPWPRNNYYVLCLLGEQKIIAEQNLLKELIDYETTK